MKRLLFLLLLLNCNRLFASSALVDINFLPREQINESIKNDRIQINLKTALLFSKNPRIDQTLRSFSYLLPVGYLSYSRYTDELKSRFVTLSKSESFKLQYNPLLDSKIFDSDSSETILTDVIMCFIQNFTNEKNSAISPGRWDLRPIEFHSKKASPIAGYKVEDLFIDFLMNNNQQTFLMSCKIKNLNSDSPHSSNFVSRQDFSRFLLKALDADRIQWWTEK